MSLPRKIAYNVIISSTAKVLSTVAALVGIGFITRYLGTDGFGMYTTALAFFSLFGALGDFGLYQISTREISRPQADEGRIIGNVASLRLIISVLLLAITPLFVFSLHYSEQLKIAIIFVAFSNVFSSYYQVIIGLFQKRLIMDRVTLSELVGKIVQVILIYIGVRYNLGFYFIVQTLLINMIINFLLVYLFSRQFIKINLQLDKKFCKELLTQALPIGLSAIVTFIYFKADTILLSFFRPPEDVGLYGAAYKVIENISFFPAMIVGLTMPIFSFHIFNNHEKFKNIVNKNFKVFMILVIPLLIGTWFLAEGIIDLIAGQEFKASANILRIIIFALGFIFFGNLFNNVLIAAKLQKHLLIILTICAIFNLTLNLIFIPRYSFYATATTSVLTEMLVVILTLSLIWRKLKFIPFTEKIIPMLFSGLLMALFLWFFKDQNFFLRLAISPLLYFGSLVALNVISKQEILSLLSKKPDLEA